MPIIAECEMPVSRFPLSETLTAVPTVEFEIDWMVADTPYITVYLLARVEDFDTLEAAFENDPSVTSVTLLCETEDDRSYTMQWTNPIELLIHIMVDAEGTIIHSIGNNETWLVRVLFPEQSMFSRTKEYAQKNGLPFNVRRSYSVDVKQHKQEGLTQAQYHSLVSAFEAGYFEIPKEATLHDLAEQEGTTHQALSERLRRGIHNLIQQRLITDPNPSGIELTKSHHDILIEAFEAGYFKVPREVNLNDLSEQREVSHQAVSERLRRGIRNLLQQTLMSETQETQ